MNRLRRPFPAWVDTDAADQLLGEHTDTGARVAATSAPRVAIAANGTTASRNRTRTPATSGHPPSVPTCESISHETVRQRLKNALKPRLTNYWEIPPKQDADFVYYMERVLDLYHESYDETRPVICFDESSKALRGHERDPLPARPGAVARIDHRYKRNGKQRIHLATEPLTGWVTVEITERRRTTEWIDRMVEIADVHYPDAECIRVVVDQLNTHKPAAFYDFFPPDQARAYLDSLLHACEISSDISQTTH